MTRDRVLSALAVLLLVLLVGSVSVSSAAEAEAAPTAQAVTTEDPDIPVEELALLLKPLTKVELLVEANAWQTLLKTKAEEIARAEIAVQRQNREIEKAEEIQEKTEEAKARLEEVEAKAAEAKASGDQEKVAETEAAAREAHEKVQAVGAAVEDAVGDAEQTAEAHEALEPQTREARVGRNSDRRFRHLDGLGNGGSPCGHPPYEDPIG